VRRTLWGGISDPALQLNETAFNKPELHPTVLFVTSCEIREFNRPMKKFLLLLFCSGAILTTGHARLGESLTKLKEHFGKPQPQAQKDAVFWLFEGEDGQLVYTVTLNAKGVSIAEGLKPLKFARLTRENAENFIDGQLGPHRGSKTARTVNPGEKYVFAGKSFVCAEQEYVIVDDANGILIVWTKGGLPYVMAVSPEMIK
jgi:hypothetical protein